VKSSPGTPGDLFGFRERDVTMTGWIRVSAILTFCVVTIGLGASSHSAAVAAPSGWQYGSNQPFPCNNPDAPPGCVSNWTLYPVPGAAIPGIMQAAPGRCYGYDAAHVICEGGPPPCTQLDAKVQYLKCTVSENVQADRLTGTFWVKVSGQPDQEISVTIWVTSDYPYPGSVVKLAQLSRGTSHLTSQARVQHEPGRSEITINQLYFFGLKRWLPCSAQCTSTLSRVPGA
jgi:hypothetical protein